MKQLRTTPKEAFEMPQIELLRFAAGDIVTASGDNNMGEWDPQPTSVFSRKPDNLDVDGAETAWGGELE